MAIFLAAGNLAFWHFDPEQPLWRRLLKVVVSLSITALAWRYFGRLGVLIWFAIIVVPPCTSTPSGFSCTASTAGPVNPARNTMPSAAGPHPAGVGIAVEWMNRYRSHLGGYFVNQGCAGMKRVVLFVLLKSARRPHLVGNHSIGFSPTQTSLRSKLRP